MAVPRWILRLAISLGLLLVLAVGISLRLDGLAVPSLWLDEILNAEIAEELGELPAGAWLVGFERENGPLYYATLAAGRALTDNPELALRGPAVVLGILGLLVAAWLGFRLAGPWGGLVSLVLTAVSPLHVVYSREGRTYALLMLLAQGLLVALLALERSPRSHRALVLGLVCAVGALYTAATGAPLLATLAITAGFLTWRGRRRGGPPASGRPTAFLAVAGVLGFLGVAAMYGRFPRGEGGPAAPFDAAGVLPGWLTGFTTSALDRTPFDPRGFFLLALALAGAWGLARRRRVTGCRLQRGPAVAALVASFALLPALVALAALAWQDHWLSIRYLSPALPAFLLLAAVGTVEVGRLAARSLGKIGRRRRAPPIAGIVTGAVILALLLPNLLWMTPAAHREPFVKPDWRRAAAWIDALAEPGDRVVAAGDWAWVCIRFYLRRPATLGKEGEGLEILNAQASVPVAGAWAREIEVRGSGVTWLVAGGFLRDRGILGWMRRFPTVANRLLGPEVHVHPDLATLAATRDSGSWEASRLAALGWQAPRMPARTTFHFDYRDGLFLGTGWGGPEVTPDGETFRWVVGRRAELLWPGALPPETAGARTGALELRLRPFRSPQTVTVEMDGRPLGTLELDEGWRDYRLSLDALQRQKGAGEPGLHRLTLGFARATAPQEVEPGSRDRRRLAAAVSRLEILSPDPRDAPAAPRPDPPPPASGPP